MLETKVSDKRCSREAGYIGVKVWDISKIVPMESVFGGVAHITSIWCRRYHGDGVMSHWGCMYGGEYDGLTQKSMYPP